MINNYLNIRLYYIHAFKYTIINAYTSETIQMYSHTPYPIVLCFIFIVFTQMSHKYVKYY